VAELADVIRAVADGGPQVTEQDLTVVLPPDDRSVGVMAFAGHNVVSVDLAQDLVRQWLPGDDLGAPLSPPFLGVLAGATGRSPDNLDLVLVAPATGRPNGMDLSELTEFVEPLPPRLARALAQRIGVRAWRCPGGLVTLGRGVAGRWEVSVEVDSTLRGFGLGRALFTAARGLLPADEHVWAQVAPGNAASVRAALAAGFRPVGAEVLLHATKVTFGPFGWFEALDEPEPAAEPEPEQRPEPEPDQAREPDDLDGRDDPDEILEQPQADEILDQDGGQVGDLADADVASAQPLSVSDKPSSENEPINSDG
jgi:GNAT superfamily N-acetyltransferase